MTYLVADIGGTKTVLGYFESLENKFSVDKLEFQKSYHSGEYESLESIISLYIQEFNVKVNRVVIAIAGPITNGRSVVTNLPWVLEEQNIKNKFNFETVKFLNDLEASAYFIPFLEESDVVVIQTGNPLPNKNISIVSPGTGLGEAFLTWDGTHYISHATEGGHTSFAPETHEQDKLLQFLREKLGKRISFERVCSGIGVKNIFDFLVNSGYKIEPDSLKKEIEAVSDIVPIVLSTGCFKPGESRICDKTIEIFVSILASECANFALKTMSLSGIFIGGGIPPKILPAISNNDIFLKYLLDKGRMSPLIKNIPVKVIINKNTTLLGCARYCFDNF